MHLAVLGPLHARLSNGTDVPLAGQRVLDLVAVLATRRGRPIDAATLRELLWGEEAGAIGDSAVHTVIARVRRLLGVDAVTTTPFGYRLAESTTVDADQFAHEVAAARRMQEPRNRVDVLERALAMWRGPAFLGADDHVVAAERVRLHELRSGSVEALVDGLLLLADAGSAEQARALAGELIHDEPLRERAYVLAMRADLQLGRTADALSTFEQLRHVLRTELGVDPGEEACQAQASALGPGPAAPPVLVPRPRSLPPAPLTSLIGREREMTALHEGLIRRRLVTILGPAGVGKSRLLAELGHTLTTTPISYVDLATLLRIDQYAVGDLLAETVGAPPTTHPYDSPYDRSRGDSGDRPATHRHDPTAPLTEHLRERALLLLIDEADRHTEALRVVLDPLLRGCPELRVCLSSRRPVELAGELLFALEPLPYPAPDADLAAIRSSPAVELFIEHVGDTSPGWRPTEAALRRAAELVRSVEGLPLGVEIVARHMANTSAPDAGSMGEPSAPPAALDLPAQPTRAARHQSLRAAIGSSLEALSVAERETFARISVFGGFFDSSAAEQIAGQAAVTALPALAREALIQVHRREGRLGYRLLRTMREFAADELRRQGDEAAIRRRHRQRYADRWEAASHTDELLDDVTEHYADALDALASALDDHDGAAQAIIAIALARWWAFTDSTGTGYHWLSRVLDQGDLTPSARARLLVMRSLVCVQHDAASARADLAAALPLLETPQDPSWLRAGLQSLGLLELAAGDWPAARSAAIRAVVVARAHHDSRLGDSLSLLGLIESIAHPPIAPALLRRAWRVATQSQSIAALGSVGNNLTLAYTQLGRPELARVVVSELEHAFADRELPAFLTLLRGWVLLGDDRAHDALDVFATALAKSGDAVLGLVAVEAYAGSACAAHALGTPESADLALGARSLYRTVPGFLAPWQRELLDRAATTGPAAAGKAGTEELFDATAPLALAKRLAAQVTALRDRVNSAVPSTAAAKIAATALSAG